MINQARASAGDIGRMQGTPEEMYLWPCFSALALESLTPPQRVELFKIVTAGDYKANTRLR